MAAGCVHGDWGDTWAPIIAAMEEHKPDVFVLCGDLLNADAISRFDKSKAKQIREEFEVMNAGMAMVRSHLKRNCRRLYTFGNHEDRFRNGIIQSGLQSLVDPSHWVPEIAKWNVITEYAYRRRCVHSVGQIDLAHGYETSATGLEREPLRMSGVNRLYVHPHTHCPSDGVVYIRMGKAGPETGHAYADIGCVGPLDHDYGLRMPSDRLGHAFGIGWCDESVPYIHHSREWEFHVVKYDIEGELENAA